MQYWNDAGPGSKGLDKGDEGGAVMVLELLLKGGVVALAFQYIYCACPK